MSTNQPVWVIDAGHGGAYDELGSSANHARGNNGLLEKDLTLDIASRVARLVSAVASVRLTRSADVNLPLSARARVARDAGATLFVSLHLNGSRDPGMDGTEAWIARTPNANSSALAQNLAARVAAATGGANRGVKKRNFGVLLPERHAPGAAACLLEIAFLTNPAQADRMMRSEYRDVVAAAIADGLRQTLQSGTATALDTPVIYQLPHFREFANREIKLAPADPGFYNGTKEFKKASKLQGCLDKVMKAKFPEVRVAVVDLSKDGPPEFAGFNYEEQVDVEGIPKMAAMLAAFQLRHDIRAVMKEAASSGTGLKTLDQLFKVMRKKWTDAALVTKTQLPQLESIFDGDPTLGPESVDFVNTSETIDSLWADIKDAGVEGTRGDDARNKLLKLGFKQRLRVMMATEVPNAVSDLIASTIVRDVGFTFMASALLQSGLYDSKRGGGLWLGSDYGHGDWKAKPRTWSKPPSGGGPRSATAGALAAFMTFLAHDDLVDTKAGEEMRQALEQAPAVTTDTFRAPFNEALQVFGPLSPLMRMRKPRTLQVFSMGGQGDAFDDCALVERSFEADKMTTLRYVAVGLRAKKQSELRALIIEIDNCILANNGLEGYVRTQEVPAFSAMAPITALDIGKFGVGTRKKASDTTATPFRWICNLVVKTRVTRAGGAQEIRGPAPEGTGVLISPCHILTAAHILKSVETRGSVTETLEADRIWVVPARNGDDVKPFKEIEAVSWMPHPDWKPADNKSGKDYAIIKLAQPVDGDCFWGSTKCGGGTVLGMPSSIAQKLIGANIVTAGYPESKNKEMWCFTGKASSGSSENDSHLNTPGFVEQWVRRNALFFLNADTEKGQSGSPVWIIDGGKRYMAGILIEARTSFNAAVTINDDVIRQIRKWTKD
jgi:N-acetylmuramoyl-L-alanine amidase/V8-like Glu-specific endopeptidase